MIERRAFYFDYDLDANTFKYGRLKGPFPGPAGITCAGATTTITAVTSGIGTFSPIRVGDFIWLRTAENTVIKRKVASKTSNDQIAVAGANLSAFTIASWDYWQFDIGTADSDGALNIANYDRVWLEFDGTLADSLDIQVEARGRAPAALWGTIFTATFANTAALRARGPVEITELVGSIRVGVKGTTVFAGTDAFSIYLCGQVRTR